MCALIDSIIKDSDRKGMEKKPNLFDIVGIVLFLSLPGDRFVDKNGEIHETRHYNVHVGGLDITKTAPEDWDPEAPELTWFTVHSSWVRAEAIEVGSLVRLKRRWFDEGEITLKDGTSLAAGPRFDMLESHAWTRAQSIELLNDRLKSEDKAERAEARKLLKIIKELED